MKKDRNEQIYGRASLQGWKPAFLQFIVTKKKTAGCQGIWKGHKWSLRS